MAKVKKTRKPKTVVFNVPIQYATDVRDLLDRRQKDDAPRKPIKRVRKIEPDELKLLIKDTKALSKRFEALERELERLDDKYDGGDDLRPSDEKWVRAYQREMYKAVQSAQIIAEIFQHFD